MRILNKPKTNQSTVFFFGCSSAPLSTEGSRLIWKSLSLWLDGFDQVWVIRGQMSQWSDLLTKLDRIEVDALETRKLVLGQSAGEK